MTDFPRSLLEFQQRFPDEDTCSAYLATLRWPGGFLYPACGRGSREGALVIKAHTHECSDYRKEALVPTGMVMHRSKLALTAWFWVAHLMVTHFNRISALQHQRQLGLDDGQFSTTYSM